MRKITKNYIIKKLIEAVKSKEFKSEIEDLIIYKDVNSFHWYSLFEYFKTTGKVIEEIEEQYKNILIEFYPMEKEVYSFDINEISSKYEASSYDSDLPSYCQDFNDIGFYRDLYEEVDSVIEEYVYCLKNNVDKIEITEE